VARADTSARPSTASNTRVQYAQLRKCPQLFYYLKILDYSWCNFIACSRAVCGVLKGAKNPIRRQSATAMVSFQGHMFEPPFLSVEIS